MAGAQDSLRSTSWALFISAHRCKLNTTEPRTL